MDKELAFTSSIEKTGNYLCLTQFCQNTCLLLSFSHNNSITKVFIASEIIFSRSMILLSN